MIELLPLVNKTAPLKFNGAELRLDLSHALFSSYEVDLGTRLLLKAVARDPALERARRILDAGCGTGVIGLALAKAFPEAELVLRDRDSLAVAFAERNRVTNKLRGRTAWTDPETGARRTPVAAPRAELGLLADGLEGGPYDYVLSNLPAKAGAPVLEAFFARAAGPAAGRAEPAPGPAGRPGFLAPGGRLAVVIVNTLAEKAAAWIAAAGLTLVSRERGSGHTVFIAESPAPACPAGSPGEPSAPEGAGRPIASPAGPELDLSGLDLSAYLRCESAFKFADVAYRARGFWGLPDFDTVGYSAALAADTAARACPGSLVREALVINPGVGHLPIWMARKLGPARISAASRDLLSLAATGANLALAGGRRAPAYRCLDELRLDELAEESSLDLLAELPELVPEYDWIGPAWERAGRLVKAGGAFLLVGPATELGRAEKRRPSGWRLAAERKRRGFVGAAWIRTS
ncbi:MAG TPA: methyltransferase [Spirochaetales bacterium]|nr:methyltransferase [Spirochaetales bacterium]HRY55380.1 methyltransferase [Spirochaetia bacterium]HRZ64539.1 methyltransferase [Spirochaetia bacterium]